MRVVERGQRLRSSASLCRCRRCHGARAAPAVGAVGAVLAPRRLVAEAVAGRRARVARLHEEAGRRTVGRAARRQRARDVVSDLHVGGEARHAPEVRVAVDVEARQQRHALEDARRHGRDPLVVEEQLYGSRCYLSLQRSYCCSQALLGEGKTNF